MKRLQIKHVPAIAVLQAIKEHAAQRFEGEPWWRRSGLERFPPKLLFAWLWTKRAGLWVEYGTSCRCCWLTEEGEQRLDAAAKSTAQCHDT